MHLKVVVNIVSSFLSLCVGTIKALTLCKPDSIVGRDEELSTLREYLSSHLRDETPGSLYISGPPGTGKTLCVSEVLEEEQVWSAKVVKVNCMALKTPKAIFGRLGEELLGNSKPTHLENSLEKFICTSDKMM